MEMRGNQDASITLDGVVDELNKLDTEHYHFKFSRRDKEHLRNRRLVSFSQRQQHKRDAQHAANRGLELAATTSIKGRNKGCSSQSGKNWVEGGKKGRSDPRALATLRELELKLTTTDDVKQLSTNVTTIRTMLSTATNAPIDEAIESGLVAPLMHLLDHEDEKLVFEACWALTNIASGTTEQTLAVVNEGAVGCFSRLLSHRNPDVQEQAAWALGNIVSNNLSCRDHVTSQNIYPALRSLLIQENSAQKQQTYAWLLMNTVRPCGHIKSSEAVASEVCGVALEALCKINDASASADILWSISWAIQDDGMPLRQLLAAPDSLQAISHMLKHGSDDVMFPAFRCLAYLATGSPEQSQLTIELGVLECVTSRLLNEQRPSHCKEMCWYLSNLAADTDDHRRLVTKSALDLLVHHVINGVDTVKKEAVWALSNLCNTTATDIIAAVVGGAMSHMLDCYSSRQWSDILHPMLHKAVARLNAAGLHSLITPVEQQITMLIEAKNYHSQDLILWLKG